MRFLAGSYRFLFFPHEFTKSLPEPPRSRILPTYFNEFTAREDAGDMKNLGFADGPIQQVRICFDGPEEGNCWTARLEAQYLGGLRGLLKPPQAGDAGHGDPSDQPHEHHYVGPGCAARVLCLNVV